MNPKTNIMEFMTIKEVRKALTRTKTVILPVGVIEQHGYHLPLNTDVYNAYEIAKRVSPITCCLVAPPVIYTFSGGTLPGTIDINPQTVSLLIMDICESLARQGLKNIIILLGHGGSENEKAVKDAGDMFLRRNPQFKDIKLAIFPFWKASPTAQKAFADKDFHAGYLESSLMLYWHPELVRKKEIVTDSKEIMEMLSRDQDSYQNVKKPVENEYVLPRITQNPRIKVGVMGNPFKSSKKFGEKVVKECVKELTSLIKEMEKR